MQLTSLVFGLLVAVVGVGETAFAKSAADSAAPNVGRFAILNYSNSSGSWAVYQNDGTTLMASPMTGAHELMYARVRPSGKVIVDIETDEPKSFCQVPLPNTAAHTIIIQRDKVGGNIQCKVRYAQPYTYLENVVVASVSKTEIPDVAQSRFLIANEAMSVEKVTTKVKIGGEEQEPIVLRKNSYYEIKPTKEFTKDDLVFAEFSMMYDDRVLGEATFRRDPQNRLDCQLTRYPSLRQTLCRGNTDRGLINGFFFLRDDRSPYYPDEK